MANRNESLFPADPLPDPLRRLEQARADLSRIARRGEDRVEATAATETARAEAPPQVDPAAIAARIDLMRARFAKARGDAISALLFLGDAQRDCDALLEACETAQWQMMATGVDLLSDCLRRALPSEERHLNLVGLLIDALYALRRAESRPDMSRAGEDLLRGLRLAVLRELQPLNV
ncbi:hypothetical protein [Ferrovibrio sp.]|jgi:hypothetical protein|uniref:hypothetical protein n=1 Tax=Ferrovibrio sp. TaxID=1917215 RepID=UPI0035B25DC4